MAIQSYIVEEGPGRGKGHTSHGNGKGKGHDKHVDDAMADGVYTIGVSGINHANHTGVSQTSAPVTLADGTSMFTEVRRGSVTIDAAPPGGSSPDALHLVTDNSDGRLRVSDVYDANNRYTLGDLDTLTFDYWVQSPDRNDVIPVIRLAIDGDGNLATLADRGELVFEWAYQGFGNVNEGSWRSADLIGDDWTVWQRANGANLDFAPNFTKFSNYADADGFTPLGGVNFNENSVVLGWSIAVGSGNGTVNAYLDNLTIAGVTMDFVG